MQQKISCFEVLEELYEENANNKNLEQIVFDISILKKYLHYWQKYILLKDIEDVFLPKRFRGNTGTRFIEDYTYEEEIKEQSSVGIKGTTKFIISLVFQETKSGEETIKDMLTGEVKAFFEDKEEELSRIALSSEDRKLIKTCFSVVKKYEEITASSRYDIFELSSHQINKMKVCLLKFKINFDDKTHWDLDYKTLEKDLNQENLLEPIEKMTYNVVSSDSDIEVHRNLMGISLLLAKLRIGITDSIALQTREVTMDKGRKNLLNFSTKMNLKELSKETERLQKELEDILEPLLSSQFICYHLYKFYFMCQGNLETQ